ncbi:MAG: hypothetical protein MZV63_07800 [Marinilabiliales bacterium]|nr:hypothetical protein [Marinilabiliales bacterium]
MKRRKKELTPETAPDRLQKEWSLMVFSLPGYLSLCSYDIFSPQRHSAVGHAAVPPAGQGIGGLGGTPRCAGQGMEGTAQYDLLTLEP